MLSTWQKLSYINIYEEGLSLYHQYILEISYNFSAKNNKFNSIISKETATNDYNLVYKIIFDLNL